jgi:hypothetical protein
MTEAVCEAHGCVAAAEEEIRVPVGQMGEINLRVCSNCRPKFVASNRDANSR